MVQNNVPRKDAYMPDAKKREDELDLDKGKETESVKDEAKEAEAVRNPLRTKPKKRKP